MAGKGKRGNNEGSVYQRASDGRWVAAVSLGNGKRKQVTGHTRQEAARKLTSIRHDLDRGIPVARDERQTVAQYLTSWLEMARPTIEPGTWERYEGDVRIHLIPALGRIRLAQLTPHHVQQLVSGELAAGRAPNTVRNIRACLRRALGDAVTLGVLPRNVAAVVRAPKAPRREMRCYTSEQARALLDAARGTRLEAIYTLALTTGMREGELLGLRWQDVNLDGGYLHVRIQLQAIQGAGLVLKDVKTAAGRRKIRLGATAVAALRVHRARQSEERLRAGALWRSDWDLVFANHLGGPLFKSNFTEQYYRPIVHKAGLPLIRFHDLRHTAATLMLLQGVPVKVVSEMLGHASIAITLNLYAHVLPEMQREAADAMDRLLGGFGGV